MLPVPPKREPEQPDDRPTAPPLTPKSSDTSDQGVPPHDEGIEDRLFSTRPEGKIAIWPLFAVVLVCALESAPTWGFHGAIFGLEAREYFWIAVVCGFVAGGLGAKYRLPGAIAGAVCMAGAFGALHSILLENNRSSRLVLMLGMAMGMLPGAILYACFETLLNHSGRRSQIPPNGASAEENNDRT